MGVSSNSIILLIDSFCYCRIFSPEAERHSHVLFKAEPDIWIVLVADKINDSEPIWRVDALRKVLKEIHSLFVMFHGSIRAMLERTPRRTNRTTFVYLYHGLSQG
ncbi:hypothetical protein JHK82_024184 [Glycine max]|nr:hypothetical protein JHK87_024144 [Glycine soja]KAG5006206.1 hypothetical protein JHK85_024748 [Glycine max]KAG5012010.1 hypothetical protein JHK86_024271 [Glycine max]KAG5132996.1 hypothetical protein JHK82_024184 [Glycine max]